MNRIGKIEIAGKEYPLCMSVKAVKAICAKYGDLDKMLDEIPKMSTIDQLTEIIWILQLLLEQGARYMKVCEDKEYRVFEVEELETLFTIHDIDSLYDSLTQALGIGSHQEVEVEPEQKNVKATRD